MPEGDTVFLAGRQLENALAGKTLTRADLRHPRLATVDLAGREILGVRSFGKRLFIRFSGNLSLHSHFRMDGAWHLYRPGQRWRRPKHQARAILEVADQVAVGFSLHDMNLLTTDTEDRAIAHLGPDLLANDWSDQHQAEAMRRLAVQPDRELGLALLDQTIMAGIGNLYKTEMCFLLGVSPWSTVAEVNAAETVQLGRKLLLANAWRAAQSTTGELTAGRRHWVFERGGRPCFRCGTIVKVGEQGQGIRRRVAYWCPNCQPGPFCPRRLS